MGSAGAEEQHFLRSLPVMYPRQKEPSDVQVRPMIDLLLVVISWLHAIRASVAHGGGARPACLPCSRNGVRLPSVYIRDSGPPGRVGWLTIRLIPVFWPSSWRGAVVRKRGGPARLERWQAVAG